MDPIHAETLILVTFQHRPEDCPVAQTKPDFANALSKNLADARLTGGEIAGAFLPPDHRGAALVLGDPAAVANMFADVLGIPPHTVQVTTATDAKLTSDLTAALGDPSLLSGDGPRAVAARTALFELAEELAPHQGYGHSVAAGVASKSLRELEVFLEDTAKIISTDNQ